MLKQSQTNTSESLAQTVACMRAQPRARARQIVAWLGLLLLVIVLFRANHVTLRAQDKADDKIVLSESKVKAVVLLNFIRYTTWPTSPSNFVLGVIGSEPLNQDFTSITNQTVGERRILIRKFNRAEEARDCQVLFVSSSEKGEASEILRQLEDASILTVGQFEGFTKLGGVVRLTLEKTEKFEISRGASKRARLNFAPELLRVASVVK